MMTDERLEQVAQDYLHLKYSYKQVGIIPPLFRGYIMIEEMLDRGDKERVLGMIHKRIETQCFPKN